jgi:ATP-dependent helicase/nuclease subunit B
MSVFTIAIDRRFADELAMGVLAQYGGDPLALADVLILLPTRRSVRALREAFLRAAHGKPTILPHAAGRRRRKRMGGGVGDGNALGRRHQAHAERDALLAQLVRRYYRELLCPPRPCRWRAAR